jgi:hypothetical protein
LSSLHVTLDESANDVARQCGSDSSTDRSLCAGSFPCFMSVLCALSWTGHGCSSSPMKEAPSVIPQRIAPFRGHRHPRATTKSQLTLLECNVGQRFSRGRALVALANEAWTIQGLEGTGGEVRCGRVSLDEGRGGGDECEQSRGLDNTVDVGQTKRAGKRGGLGLRWCGGLCVARFWGHKPCSSYSTDNDPVLILTCLTPCSSQNTRGRCVGLTAV